MRTSLPTRVGALPARLAVAGAAVALAAACTTAPELSRIDRQRLATGATVGATTLTFEDGHLRELWVPSPLHEVPPRAARGLTALLPGLETAAIGQGRAEGRYRGEDVYGPDDHRGAVVEADGTLWCRWHRIALGDAPRAVAHALDRDPEARLVRLSFVQGGGGPDRYRALLEPRLGATTVVELAPDGRVLDVRHRVAAELEFTAVRRD